MIYRPDGWTILKFSPANGERTYYKIFATWRWGNEDWRLSSGAYNAKNIVETASSLLWPQLSGSTYELPFDGQSGRTLYQSSAMEYIMRKAKESSVHCEVVLIQNVPQYQANIDI